MPGLKVATSMYYGLNGVFTPPSSPDVHLRLPTVGQDVRLDNRIIDLRTVWAWRGCNRERMEWVMLVDEDEDEDEDDDDDDDDVWSVGWLVGLVAWLDGLGCPSMIWPKEGIGLP